MLQEGYQGFPKSSYHFLASSSSRLLPPYWTIFMSTCRSFSMTRRLDGVLTATPRQYLDGLEELSGRERREEIRRRSLKITAGLRVRTRKRLRKTGMRIWKVLESPDLSSKFSHTQGKPHRGCWRCMSDG